MAPAPTFLNFGGHVCVLLALLGASGLQFGSPGVILASLGHHLCNLLSLLAVDRKRVEKGSKKVPKRIGFGSQAGRILMIFRVFVESGKQRLDCACAVGLGFWPLVFSLWASMGALCFFNVFLMSFGVPPGAHFTGRRQRRGPVN